MVIKFVHIFVIVCGIAWCKGQECGGELDPEEYSLKNPGYPTEGNMESKYPSNTDCIWTFSGDDNTLFAFKFWDIVIEIGENNSNITCDYDFLNVSVTSVGSQLFCGWVKPEDAIVGVGSVYIHFHSDDSVNFRGFQASYSITTDFDPCDPDPCEDGECGRTEDKLKSLCHCNAGSTGEECEVDIKECDSNPCQNGGSCDEPQKDYYTCQCMPQWMGAHCEVEKGPPCASDPCVNGGICSETEDFDFQCACEDGYIGKSCEIDDFPPCFSNPCQNDGNCTDISNPAAATSDEENEYITRYNGYHCSCPPGYGGTNCDTEVGCGNPGIAYLKKRRRFNTGSILEFSCENGFVLIGPANLTCVADETWSEKMPECVSNKTLSGDNSLSPYASTMIALGAALSVNMVVFTLWMVYRGPWVKLIRRPSASTSDSKQNIHSVSISVSVMDDDVFEDEQNYVTEDQNDLESLSTRSYSSYSKVY
ncbi:unnamed protein product [Clavelina lepadiformis]|uniref:Uncharacterized protein n=1 Tax=Clavelina lepadiformis TaxID=159417 RepID=A0ABP0H1R2_CLALP